MHLVYCFLAVLIVVQGADQHGKSIRWNLFKLRHNKKYIDAKEEQHRRIIFEDNVAKINRHNDEANLGLHTYTLKVNGFADMTHEEFLKKVVRGSKKNTATEVSKTFHRRTYFPSSSVVIPDAIDWIKKGAVLSVIEDQGQCGSNYAFAAKGALEGQHFLKTGKLVRLSAQNILDCSDKYGNKGCDDGYADFAFEYIKYNRGVDTDISYPYEGVQRKCRFNQTNVGATDTGFVNIPSGNETALQIALATVGPIAVAVDASHSTFQFYSQGVYNEPDCSKTELDHPFFLVGYDTFVNGTVSRQYYNAKNSWGGDWGLKGYIWMSRNKNNQCGIATSASYPLV